MAWGFGAKRPNFEGGSVWGTRKGSTYIPGMGYSASPGISYTNDLGERVSMTSGILRNSDGTPHVAYEGAQGTYIGNLIARQKQGQRLNEYEVKALRDFWAKNPMAGLASVNNLGGNHNGGTTTDVNDPRYRNNNTIRRK